MQSKEVNWPLWQFKQNEKAPWDDQETFQSQLRVNKAHYTAASLFCDYAVSFHGQWWH